MELLLKNIHYVDSENELFVDEVSAASDFDGASFINCNNYIAFPGFADVHVHFREPGFIYNDKKRQYGGITWRLYRCVHNAQSEACSRLQRIA